MDKEYDLKALDDFDDICKDCVNWKDFKEKCWYFWELKKDCSQKLKG